MQKNVLNTDLTGKVAVVTGAGGVLCSYFAKVLARAGAKVALLDLNFDTANQFAEEITAEGGLPKRTAAMCWTRISAIPWQTRCWQISAPAISC